jgi:hypothetical protein
VEKALSLATRNFIGSQSIDAMVLLWLMARWCPGSFSGGCFGYGGGERQEMFGLCAQTPEEFLVEFSFVGVGCAIASRQLFSLVCSVRILRACIALYSVCL